MSNATVSARIRRIAVYTFAILALSLAVNRVQAQQDHVIGVVRDAVTGTALPAAKVTILDSIAVTLTNASGYFILSGLTQGTYTVEVEYLGYERQILVVQVDGEHRLTTIELEPRTRNIVARS